MRLQKEPLRLIVGIGSILFIVFMWAKKDITAAYADLPQEQLIPVFVTTAAVSLLKIAAIAATVFLGKRLVGKIKSKNR